jgi:hypothetical protein
VRVHVPDNNVPALAGDDDEAIARWAVEHRRRVGQRLLAGAAAIAVPAIWWIRKGVAESGDALLIWAPAGIALVVAAGVAIAGVIQLVTPPPARTDAW